MFIFCDESKNKIIQLIIAISCKKTIEAGRLLIKNIFSQINV